jgi:hypothetical protein
VIELSATHIYESALPLSPSLSLIQAKYWDQVLVDVNFSLIDDTWDGYVRALQLQGFVGYTEFSHRDDLIAVGEGNIVEIFEAIIG